MEAESKRIAIHKICGKRLLETVLVEQGTKSKKKSAAESVQLLSEETLITVLPKAGVPILSDYKGSSLAVALAPLSLLDVPEPVTPAGVGEVAEESETPADESQDSSSKSAEAKRRYEEIRRERAAIRARRAEKKALLARTQPLQSSVIVVNLETKKAHCVGLSESASRIYSLSLDPTGSTICLGCKEGKLYWIQMDAIERPAKKRKLTNLTNSSDSQSEVTDFSMRHWHDHAVTALGMSPNGDLTISAGERATVCFWSALNSGRDRTALKNLEAPVLELATPCPLLVVHNKKALDKIRSLVALQLASNGLAIVDTSTARVVKSFTGIQSLCIPPQVHMDNKVEATVRRLRRVADGNDEAPVLIPSRITVSTRGSLVIQPFGDGLIVVRTCPEIERHTIDVGRLDLFNFQEEDQLLVHVGGHCYRRLLEWSRQVGVDWLSFWRTTAFACESDLSSMVIAESQVLDEAIGSHQLSFFVTKEENYCRVCNIAMASPVTTLDSLTLEEKPHAYIVGTQDGVICVYEYRQEGDVQSFILSSRIRLMKNFPIVKVEQASVSMVLVLSYGVVSVLKLRVTDIGSFSFEVDRTLNPAPISKDLKFTDFAVGKKWCVSVGENLVQADSLVESDASKSLHLKLAQGSSVSAIHHRDADRFMIVAEHQGSYSCSFVSIKTDMESRPGLIIETGPVGLQNRSEPFRIYAKNGKALAVLPNDALYVIQ
eukprot:Protomagalhaensia_sp_Gyna_25__5256@NODE_644_length_2922_cov_9_703434_g501_i0_p1_GENE_NODE_644_length_2922_cov_9_703434_g501_i0NODE_644_length_2922_cov_9_703434_g501_i0_p1_ORF_typecomplete_len716_score110_14ANAPC4_WD40/PF12894_7/0_0076ANAPC4_WD40/PF12894_7/0_63ANAPC4_WD40/PF12894_7/1_3e03ANAPC4_WD40/PF12894_7/9_1e02ANAPC4_WD40/PF12894_7/9_4e03Ge1_WD40/PF16529_5/41Ge1_WD40/PF16529_5/0_0026Ge1_WD40/PF16529_5/57WD40/PF00400_32/2_4e02WD40/PF00400_32/0_018WD40/PF00400_32/4_5e03FTA4/PF13093_6/0_018Cwf_